jgi:hypothetical protein
MTVVGFFIRHFTERGTEVSVFDYAHYNETLLGNTSIILCFTPETQRSIGFPETRVSYSKFAERFRIVEIRDIREAAQCGLDVFYTQTHGCHEDIYRFENKALWGRCKTIKHCVFDTRYPQADTHIAISDQLNVKFGTNLPVVPYMISLDPTKETLRSELGIPADALVFGRYGGYDTFDVGDARDAVKAVAGGQFYFIFMNTPSFVDHPNVKFLPMSTDPLRKRQFINTCDACLHGRVEGETFGLAVGEFAVCLKPIFTWAHGKDYAHIMILGEKAIQYSSTTDLVDKLRSFHPADHDMSGNGYLRYTPEAVVVRLASFY